MQSSNAPEVSGKLRELPICSHCGHRMVRMTLPDNTGFKSEFFYVCFNDDCPYFVDGWRWMWEHYEVKSSYRNRINPVTGKEGPLPVWSKDAMKDRILPQDRTA